MREAASKFLPDGRLVEVHEQMFGIAKLHVRRPDSLCYDSEW